MLIINLSYTNTTTDLRNEVPVKLTSTFWRGKGSACAWTGVAYSGGDQLAVLFAKRLQEVLSVRGLVDEYGDILTSEEKSYHKLGELFSVLPESPVLLFNPYTVCVSVTVCDCV